MWVEREISTAIYTTREGGGGNSGLVTEKTRSEQGELLTFHQFTRKEKRDPVKPLQYIFSLQLLYS